MGLRRLIALGLALSLGACSAEEPAGEPTLLVPVYFYHGHSVGRASRTTGLQASTDGGRTFRCLTWPELITNSVSVDASGRWVYLACGNGVMVSPDGGASFRLTGGWEMAEVQRVAIDRRDPARAWAATAYGVWRTEDGGDTWTKAEHEKLFRYCTDVLQDEADPDTLWIAAHDGVFVSRDGGGTFEPERAGAPVRRIARAGRRLLAASDGDGLLESADGGRTWRRVEGPPDVTFCAVGEGDALYVGSMEGLSVSRDGGRTWRTSSEGMPDSFYVYGILPAGGRLLVCGSDGVLESTDDGRTFTRHSFEGALVHDLAHARLVRELHLVDVSHDRGFPVRGRAYNPEYRPAIPAFDERRRELLAHFQGLPPPAEGRWMGWFRAALAPPSEELWDETMARLEEPQHSMFFSMPLMGFFLHRREQMPERLAERIREVMTTNPVYRGDTENHWVMHYTATLLAAQTWPETRRWYTGQTTQEVYGEARGWLLHWARLTAGYGQGEYDSPNYFFMYVTPMLLLYDFAKLPLVKRMAGMMLDLLLADYLVESLRGAWCGGHSRIIGKEVERTTGNRITVLHWLYAGGIPRPARINEWAAFAALSSYRPPKVLEAIANRREPYEHYERKRMRNVIRFSQELNPPVYKYDLMTPVYCMGSTQGGILQPIQQHTWDVTWLGSAENSTLFTVHPSVSEREVGMFFPEEIHGLVRTITAQKGVYSSPDKLIGGSPWETVRQRGNVLVASYRVPAGERYAHVDLYWPDCLDRTEEGGWLFGRDGEFWVAVRPSRKSEWIDGDGYRKLRCPADRTDFVVVTRIPGGASEDFESFRSGILAGPIPEVAEPDRARREQQLFEGPFLHAETGKRVIRVTAGGTTRTLDFNSMRITESR